MDSRTRQTVTEVLSEPRRELGTQEQRGNDETNATWDEHLVRTKEEYNFGSDASCVQDMLEEFNMSALESTPALSWNRLEADEKDLPASAEN